MKRNRVFLFVICLSIAFSFLNCATTRQYNFSLKNTLSIFLLDNGNNYYFAIPVQYIGDYQIQSFEFNNGYILIGDFKIVLTRDEINIDVFVNESSDEYGTPNLEFFRVNVLENL